MVTLVTNDSKRSRRMYAKKCKALGFDALADDDGTLFAFVYPRYELLFQARTL